MLSFVPALLLLDTLVSSSPIVIDITEPFVSATSAIKKANSFIPKLKHVPEWPEETVRRDRLLQFHESSPPCTQGSVGTCHVFATKNVFYDATGHELSQTRLFLDHLFNTNKKVAVNPDLAADHNLQFIKNQKQLVKDRTVQANPFWQFFKPQKEKVSPIFNKWEGGDLERNLELLKSAGGVVAPESELKDWKSVEATMQSLTEERKYQIRRFRKLPDSKAEQRLKEAGVSALSAKAESEGDRFGVVMNDAKELDAVPVIFTDRRKLTSLDAATIDRVTKLVETLKHHAVYLHVNSKFYRKVIQGEHLPPNPLFPDTYDHAITLAGYDYEENKFLVLDSNRPDMLRIDASDLVQTIPSTARGPSAFILQKH